MECIVCNNRAEALRRAGSKSKNPALDAYKMHSRPHVQKRIAELQMARNARLEVDSDYVLSRLVAEAEAKVGDLFHADNTLKPVREWPDIWQKGLVAGVDVRELFEGPLKDRVKVGEMLKIRFADRFRRVKAIGDHVKVGAFKETKGAKVSDPLRELYAQIQGRMIKPKEDDE